MTDASPAATGIARSPLAAALLVLQFLAMWGTLVILAPTINWPASLDEPASVNLPLILDQSGAVFGGYLSYAIHSLILVFLTPLLMRPLGLGGSLGVTAVVLGALAGFSKLFGIVRWLFLMPELATAYVDPAATEAQKTAISVVYEAFNAYAGGVGELMGVALFAGIWTLLLSVALARQGAGLLSKWGFAAGGLLLFTLITITGVEATILLIVSGALWQFWTFALAIRLWRRG